MAQRIPSAFDRLNATSFLLQNVTCNININNTDVACMGLDCQLEGIGAEGLGEEGKRTPK